MTNWQGYLLAKLIQVLIGMITPDVLKKFADVVLDFFEDLNKESITAVCSIIRATFNIPEFDD